MYEMNWSPYAYENRLLILTATPTEATPIPALYLAYIVRNVRFATFLGSRSLYSALTLQFHHPVFNRSEVIVHVVKQTNFTSTKERDSDENIYLAPLCYRQIKMRKK